MNFSALTDALRELWPDTYKLAAPKGKTKYIVLAPYSMGAVYGDDRTQIRFPKVQIDAYCQEEDAAADGGFFVSILNTLDALGVPHDVQDISYDPDATLQRCIIQCELIGGF